MKGGFFIDKKFKTNRQRARLLSEIKEENLELQMTVVMKRKKLESRLKELKPKRKINSAGIFCFKHKQQISFFFCLFFVCSLLSFPFLPLSLTAAFSLSFLKQKWQNKIKTCHTSQMHLKKEHRVIKLKHKKTKRKNSQK